MGANGSKDENWQKDADAPKCGKCATPFSLTTRRHHCRNCGLVVCNRCSNFRSTAPSRDGYTPVRVCADCYSTFHKAGAPGYEGSVRGSASVTGWGFDGCVSSATERDNTRDGTECESPEDPTTTAVDEWENNCCFVGTGGSVRGNGQDEGGADAYCSNGALYADLMSPKPQAINKTPLQLEKERLLQRWTDVHQQAVFIDIQLQEVERVEEYTTVGYCQEVENIMLQPELPEHLSVMFPFPQACEFNADLLMKPLDLRAVQPFEETNQMKSAMEKVAKRLRLPPLLES